MDQEWIQDKDKSISDLIEEAKAGMGENITVGRFCRIRVGEAREG
jgi:translation elongation factor EF-Ts